MATLFTVKFIYGISLYVPINLMHFESYFKDDKSEAQKCLLM